MTTNNYVLKDVEISNNCDEYEWESFIEDARTVLEEVPSTCRLMWLTAGNVDWQGRNGYAVKPIPEAEDLWSTLAGWKNADWTLRVVEATGRKIMATAYSHDTPTGGGRVATFMDGALMYERLLAIGWTYQKLVHELQWRSNGHVGYWNKALVIDILENDMAEGELMELFE